MAVHNGAALLRQKIEHLLTIDYPENLVEVIIVSDGSSDGTNEILRTIQSPRLRKVILDNQCGKSTALNQALSLATGEIVLFVDIRPWLEPTALRQLISNFADPQVGCAAGELVLESEGHDQATAAVGGMYWRYEQWLRHREAAIDSATSVYGGFYAIRRELLTKFPDGLILDDMYQPLSVVRAGYRVVSDPAARVADSWPMQTADEFRRKVRTLAGNFQLISVAPWVLSSENRLRGQLVSHKLLRLAAPLLLGSVLVTSGFLIARSWWYALCFLVQVCFYLLALMGLTRTTFLRRVTGPAAAFLVLNAAVVGGFLKFMFHPGPLWKIWTMPHVQVAAAGTEKHSGGRERIGSATSEVLR